MRYFRELLYRLFHEFWIITKQSGKSKKKNSDFTVFSFYLRVNTSQIITFKGYKIKDECTTVKKKKIKFQTLKSSLLFLWNKKQNVWHPLSNTEEELLWFCSAQSKQLAFCCSIQYLLLYLKKIQLKDYESNLIPKNLHHCDVFSVFTVFSL